MSVIKDITVSFANNIDQSYPVSQHNGDLSILFLQFSVENISSYPILGRHRWKTGLELIYS